MERKVDADHEAEVFRPVRSVGDLPEHTRLRLTSDPAIMESTRRTTPEEVEAHIAELASLAQTALGALTPEEEAALRVARLDQRDFFAQSTA